MHNGIANITKPNYNYLEITLFEIQKRSVKVFPNTLAYLLVGTCWTFFGIDNMAPMFADSENHWKL